MQQQYATQESHLYIYITEVQLQCYLIEPLQTYRFRPTTERMVGTHYSCILGASEPMKMPEIKRKQRTLNHTSKSFFARLHS